MYYLKRVSRAYLVIDKNGNVIKEFVGRRCRSRAREYVDRLNNRITASTLTEDVPRSRRVHHWSGSYREEGKLS